MSVGATEFYERSMEEAYRCILARLRTPHRRVGRGFPVDYYTGHIARCKLSLHHLEEAK